MPTPPRKITTLSKNRAGELAALERALERAADFLVLARYYAEDGAAAVAGDRLESARDEVSGVLEELNTFRAPVPTAKKPKKEKPLPAFGTPAAERLADRVHGELATMQNEQHERAQGSR